MKHNVRLARTAKWQDPMYSSIAKPRELLASPDHVGFSLTSFALYPILAAQKGTIETVLTILAREKIDVRVLKQRENHENIYRVSMLSGQSSGRQFLLAKSRIDGSLLPPQIVKLVRMKRMGIGSILSKSKLETFVEINQTGFNNKSNHPYRKYTIFYRMQPAIKIRETFLF